MAYGMAGKSPKGINIGTGAMNKMLPPRTGGPLMMDPNMNPNSGMPYKRSIEELQAMQQSGQELKPIQQRRLENYQMPKPVQTQPFPINPVQRPTLPNNGFMPSMPPMNQDPRFANIQSLPLTMNINDPRLAQVRPYFPNSPFYKK